MKTLFPTHALLRLLGAAGLACAVLATPAALAQQSAYPAQPITMVVPHAPGGTNDIVARLMAAELAPRLGQTVVVNNRPGAGGNIGTEQVSRATPDGYTVLMTVSSTQVINPALYSKPGFDAVKDFAPVHTVGVVPNVLLVHPDFPARNLAEFIEVVKRNPGKYQYASAGNGSLNHLLGAMLNQMAGLQLEHVPYRGVAPAMTDVLGNQLPIVFASLPSSLAYIQAGKLRALGVSTATRSPALPDVPAIGEQIPGYSGDLWIAMFAVAGTPPAVIERLAKASHDAMADPAVQKKLAEIGVERLDDTPQQLAKRQDEDLVRWKRIVDASGARVD